MRKVREFERISLIFLSMSRVWEEVMSFLESWREFVRLWLRVLSWKDCGTVLLCKDDISVLFLFKV